MTDYILNILEKHFGYPCSKEAIKAELHNNALEWCESQCGKATAAECWNKYFQIKLEEQNNV